MGREYQREQPIPPYGVSIPGYTIYETYDTLCQKYIEAAGDDYIVELTQNYALNGKYCLHMKTKATDPSSSDYVRVKKPFTLLRTPKVIVSMDFIAEVPSLKMDVRIDLFYPFREKNYFYLASVTIHMDDGKLYIWNQNGAWQLIDTLGALRNDAYYHYEYAIDLTNQYYEYFIIGAYRVDLSDYQFQKGSGWYGEGTAAPIIYNLSTYRANIYVDNLVVQGLIR